MGAYSRVAGGRVIRSGEHELWDAYVATIPQRARVSPILAVALALGVLGRAYAEAVQAAARSAARALRGDGA